MKFDDKFSNVSQGIIISTEDGPIEKHSNRKECYKCKNPTSWFSSIFDKYFCSEECLNDSWYKFWRE